ncbi:hypothetical protein CCUG20998_04289 [Mycobacterium marinum]|nr:hypothetical protein CCUG20998_04289 [Mycobacterium marinum]
MVVPGTRVRLRAPRAGPGAPGGLAVRAVTAAPGVRPQLGVVLVMAVWVASAGVVVAVVMGLVVWGMSLPVVPAVMGVSVARPAPVVRPAKVVVARPGPRGPAVLAVPGVMVVPGTRVRLRAPRAVSGAPGGLAVRAVTAAPGAGLARVALLVMAVRVASAGVVVAVVMGLVVWGMSLPVVPAVMGVSVARPEPVVRPAKVVVARPGPRGPAAAVV